MPLWVQIQTGSGLFSPQTIFFLLSLQCSEDSQTQSPALLVPPPFHHPIRAEAVEWRIVNHRLRGVSLGVLVPPYSTISLWTNWCWLTWQNLRQTTDNPGFRLLFLNKLLCCITVSKSINDTQHHTHWKWKEQKHPNYIYLNLLHCVSRKRLTPRLGPACCRDGKGGKHCRWGAPSGSTAWMIWRNSLK